MAITWNETTESCDTGSESGVEQSWTNPSNAWDENDSNVATITLSKFDQSKHLNGTFSGTFSGSGTIARVWVGVKGETTNASDVNVTIQLADGTGGTGGTASTIYGFVNTNFSSDNVEETIYVEMDLYNNIYTRSTLEDLYCSVNIFNLSSSSETIDINQLYLKYEYTTTAVDRTDLSVEFDTGTTNSVVPYDDVDWSNTSNAFDGTTSTYASVTTTGASNYSYYLRGTANDNTETTGDIRGVAIECYGYRSAAAGPVSESYISQDNGSAWTETTDLDWQFLPQTTPDPYMSQLGNFIESTSWTWTKINDCEFRIGYGDESSTMYVSRVRLGVTYFEETPLPKLHYRKSGATTDITLYSTDNTSWNQTLVLRDDSQTLYAQCDSNLSHTNATDLRVRVDGTTYTVLSEEGTPT